MGTAWLPALLILLAIALVIFGPSRLIAVAAAIRRATRTLLERLREQGQHTIRK